MDYHRVSYSPAQMVTRSLESAREARAMRAEATQAIEVARQMRQGITPQPEVDGARRPAFF